MKAKHITKERTTNGIPKGVEVEIIEGEGLHGRVKVQWKEIIDWIKIDGIDVKDNTVESEPTKHNSILDFLKGRGTIILNGNET